MNNIKSNVVNLGTTQDPYLLSAYISSEFTKPLSMFGDTEAVAMSNAVDYLKEHRNGTIEVPPKSTTSNAVYLKAKLNKSNQVMITVITHNYRFPINSESRPISVDNSTDWQVGDIIFNNDITSSNRCIGWICLVSGTPGTWSPFGYVKSWFTEIEKVSKLPDPSILQEGRQVICRSSEGMTYLYYCAHTKNDTEGNAVYEWVKQNIFESDIEDKITELFDPRWTQLMKDLDNNLSERIGPAIDLYFKNNPVPTVVATVSVSSNKWVISKLGSIIIESTDTLTKLKTKLPSKYVVLMDAPANSVASQSIVLGKVEIPLTHSDGTNALLNEITSGEVVTVNLNISNRKATIPTGNSESVKFTMDGNVLKITGNAYIRDDHILVLG